MTSGRLFFEEIQSPARAVYWDCRLIDKKIRQAMAPPFRMNQRKGRAVEFGECLLNAEVGKHFGLGFFYGQQVVAGGAILRDAGGVFGYVVAVVAAEAAGILLVADVVGMGSPGDFHEGEHILAVEKEEFLPGRLHQRRLSVKHIGMLAG